MVQALNAGFDTMWANNNKGVRKGPCSSEPAQLAFYLMPGLPWHLHASLRAWCPAEAVQGFGRHSHRWRGRRRRGRRVSGGAWCASVAAQGTSHTLQLSNHWHLCDALGHLHSAAPATNQLLHAQLAHDCNCYVRCNPASMHMCPIQPIIRMLLALNSNRQQAYRARRMLGERATDEVLPNESHALSFVPQDCQTHARLERVMNACSMCCRLGNL
jgi:hypothetical protein